MAGNGGQRNPSILNKKKKDLRTYIQCKFSLNRYNTLQILFHVVIIALKMNITTKAGSIKSTDQFDSRSGQNLKMRF